MTKEMTEREIDEMIREGALEDSENTNPDQYPSLHTISNAFFKVAQPIPKDPVPPEFLYFKGDCRGPTEEVLALHSWNSSWEQAQLRNETCDGSKLPAKLRWLDDTAKNIYVLPWATGPRYYAYAPLYHLLPKRILERHGLPVLKRGLWPFTADYMLNRIMPLNMNERLGKAFATYIWPLLSDSGPKQMGAFSEEDPIKLIAHNLDFWLPFAYQAIEEIARAKPVTQAQPSFRKTYNELQPIFGAGVDVRPPRCGGNIWDGEAEALQVTKRIVELADKKCRIRDMVELVKSNRTHDDFSDRWSTQKIDFERSFYHTRVKVSFLEIGNTVPVHGPEAEFQDNSLWSDLISFVNPKDRSLVVLLRSGPTTVGDLSESLGYKNHSAVSKKLAKIRLKAKKLLN